MEVANSIALVTGANGGLGQYYVEALRSRFAAKIYAGARNPKTLESLVADHPDIVIPIALDITDEQSVRQTGSGGRSNACAKLKPTYGKVRWMKRLLCSWR
jgi:NADP-dependent 3-hydroxy acid dehydrogenase YdfG